MLLPLTFSNKKNNDGMLVLAGDVGATKTNLSLYRINENNITSLKESKYQSKQHEHILEIMDDFLKGLPQPDAVCFGVAGPVLNGTANLTNLGWKISSRQITEHSDVAAVQLINDLEAVAYGLAMLTEKDVVVLQEGSGKPVGNAAVIAPGTGLGEAGLYWDGNYYHPFATEGGHSDFACRNEFDFELFSFLQKKFDHVSCERLVCGPGIFNIYQFLRDEKKREEPVWLKEKLKNKDAAAVISATVNDAEICKETMQIFVRYLGYESASLVLKLKATGGLFIGGGIAPQIIKLFKDYNFEGAFCSSGRLNYLLEKVPVKIILNTKTALLGAAYYGAKHSVTKAAGL